ncbi:MAG TPA: hypothetical protein V6D29_24065 [Leptolyngbyaceae cyanobacterium]
MTTATKTKTKKQQTNLPGPTVETSPTREFQPGDIVEGQNPVGKTIRGMVDSCGLKWIRLANKQGAILLATARLIEAATEEPEFFNLAQLLRDSLGFVPCALYGEPEPELDTEPIDYRGWQMGTESPNGGMLAIDICSPDGEWWTIPTECIGFGYNQHDAALDWAKSVVDDAIALQEKLSGQIPLIPPENPQGTAESSDPLTALATEIDQLNREGDEALATALAAGNAAFHLRLAMGERLERAKKLVKASGQRWLPWLQENCPNVSERTCQLSMRLHKHREQLQAQADFAQLTLTEADAMLRKPKELPPAHDPDAMADEEGAELEEAGVTEAEEERTEEDLLDELTAYFTDAEKKTFNWLTNCSVGDVNFANQLTQASAGTIHSAIAYCEDRPEGNKSRLQKLQAELSRRAGTLASAEIDEDAPIYTDAQGQPIAIGDPVVWANGYQQAGTVERLDPSGLLPVVIRCLDGVESRAKAEALLVVDEWPASSLEAAHSPASTASQVVEPETALETYRGLLEVGAIVIDKYRPNTPLVVAKTSPTQACCWGFTEEMWIGWGQLEPYTEFTAISLESICKWRLEQLIQVAGKDAVMNLLKPD